MVRYSNERNDKLIPYFEYIAEVPQDIMSSVDYCITDGLKSLGLDNGASPISIIKAIDRLVTDFRKGENTYAEFESAEDVAVTAGVLFGYSVCRQYGWQWAYTGMKKETATLAIVSPLKYYCIMPLYYINTLSGEEITDIKCKEILNMFLRIKKAEKKKRQRFLMPLI